MTKQQVKETREILAALVKQNRNATLTASARIVLTEAATEMDPGLKQRLLILAGRIQALGADDEKE